LSKPSRLSCAAAETLNSDWFAPSDENLKRQWRLPDATFLAYRQNATTKL
jgi:hypothetical protein